jgi:hypothetical protein
VDIKGLRTLNLAGTILFGLFGIGLPLFYFYYFSSLYYRYSFSPFDEYMSICLVVLVVWMIIITILTYLLYHNTVLGLDRGDYEAAKRWMLIGAVVGFLFAGGVVTLIIFLIGFVSADQAIWSGSYYAPPAYYGSYPPLSPQYQTPYAMPKHPISWSPCTNCGRLVSSSWITCPYCSVKLPKKLIHKGKK